MKRTLWLTGLFAVTALTLWTTIGWASAAQAASDGPAGRAPLPTATVEPTAAAPEPTRVSLSAIRLQASGAPATAWTVMQWQDALGGWHDVEGWRGEFDADGYKTWRFPEQHFGTGPFRWEVFSKRDGGVWGVSAPFQLPDGRDQLLTITVTHK